MSEAAVNGSASASAPASAAPEQSAGGAKARGRRAFWVLGLLVAAVLAAIALYAWLTRHRETTDDAQVDADVVAIAARTSGQILRLRVADNSAVRLGDVLIELDDADALAKLDQARAEEAVAEAQLALAEAQELIAAATAKGSLGAANAMLSGSSQGVAAASAEVGVAKAALERAIADEKKAARDRDRFKELLAKNATTAERAEAAETSWQEKSAALAQQKAAAAAALDRQRVAESRVAEAAGRVTEAEPIDARLKAARAQTLFARARVQSTHAAAVLAQNQLAYTKVLAPADGVVTALSSRVGQLVSVGQPLAELVPTATYVVANFKETQLENMRQGDRVVVHVDAFPGHPVAAHVGSLAGGTGARFSLMPADNASGNFVKVVQRVPVRIEWDQPPDLPLRAGLSVEATVYTSQGR